MCVFFGITSQADLDNVKLPGGVKKQCAINSSALMSMFNEVRQLELRESVSDKDTFAILRAYSLVGDAEAARRMFFFRRSLKHPIVVSNFDPHTDDDLTLYLRSLTTITAKRGGGDWGHRKNWVSEKYKPAQIMVDVFKVVKVRMVGFYSFRMVGLL